MDRGGEFGCVSVVGAQVLFAVLSFSWDWVRLDAPGKLSWAVGQRKLDLGLF